MRALDWQCLIRLGVLATICPLACAGSDGESGLEGAVSIGALLPFTGTSATEGINLERALILATERVNAAGGVAGKPLRLIARDTHSDLKRGLAAAMSLVGGYPIAAFIGPVETDVVIQLAPFIGVRQVVEMLPAVTSPSVEDTMGADSKWWFLMAPGPSSLACAIAARMKADRIENPVFVHAADAFNVAMAKALSRQLERFGSSVLLPGGTSYQSEVAAIVARKPDAIVLLDYPTSSARFVYEVSLSGYPGLRRWYLGPTLESEVFVETSPPGALDGVVGVAQGIPDPATFAAAFRARWNEEPITGAYGNFDALLVLALALEAADHDLGMLPSSAQLTERIHRIARPPGTPVRWDDYARAVELVRAGEDIDFEGTSGSLDFSPMNQVTSGVLRYWTVEGRHIVDGGYDGPACF